MSKISRRDFMKNSILMSAGMTTLSSPFVTKTWAAPSDVKSSSLLLMPPFLGKPTHSSITLNLVAGEKNIVCYVKYRENSKSRDKPWQQIEDIPINAFSPADMQMTKLRPGTLYQYELYASLRDGKDFLKVSAITF
jgi:hypothetical protein